MGFHLLMEGLWVLVVSLPCCERGDRGWGGGGGGGEGVEGVSAQKIVLLGLTKR